VSAGPDARTCPACGAAIGGGDAFCEACGADLPGGASATEQPSDRCGSCGGAVGTDGYCELCGMKAADPHDHEEVDLGWVAGVCDRGRRHPCNEDAMVLAAPRDGLAVAVVCDGVSSSSNAAAAAAAAVDAAGSVLLAAAGGDAHAALVEAAAAAREAVVAVPAVGDGDPPSCTFVAAALRDGELTVGWLGDSRAYWLGAGGNVRLTTDDSWATEQVAAGLLTEAAAEDDDRAHAITRWLGADAPDTPPRTFRFPVPGRGRVVLCSDGLWNYASGADRLASVLGGVAPDASPLDVARHLTHFACESGGHDNITVVVLAL
jgi:serine/threonine protein phosphatase PrpC